MKKTNICLQLICLWKKYIITCTTTRQEKVRSNLTKKKWQVPFAMLLCFPGMGGSAALDFRQQGFWSWFTHLYPNRMTGKCWFWRHHGRWNTSVRNLALNSLSIWNPSTIPKNLKLHMHNLTKLGNYFILYNKGSCSAHYVPGTVIRCPRLLRG